MIYIINVDCAKRLNLPFFRTIQNNPLKEKILDDIKGNFTNKNE